MTNRFTADAARVIENMARDAAQIASRPGVLLGQHKYHADPGLLLVVAQWDRDPHRITLRWSLTPERGAPARQITEAEAQAFVERRMEARLGDDGGAARLIADYADLGVSCGYIGNIYYGPTVDDRQFRVFTKLQPCVWREGVDRTYSVPVFTVPRDHKGVWMDAVQFDTPAVRAQLDKLRARVTAGELFVSTARPEAVR